MQKAEDASGAADALTGCVPFSEFRTRLERCIVDRAMSQAPVGLVLIGIGRFPRFRRRWGNAFADEILKFVASTLRLSLEGIDQQRFRHGDDSFLVLFPGLTTAEAKRCALQVARTIRYRPFLSGGQLYRVRLSIGVVGYPADVDDLNRLLACGEAAKRVAQRLPWLRAVQYRWIAMTLAIQAAVALVLAAAVIALAVRLTPHRPPPMPIEPRAAAIQGVAASASALPEFADADASFDRIVLKSGGFVEGTIIRRDAAETEVRMAVERGGATVRVRNADIQSITLSRGRSKP
jgi:diguanylate cyclase (GGDEF)-like protein